VTALSAALKSYGNPPALKALLARMADFPQTSSRFPLVDLTDEQADALWTAVRSL
jgi:4-hydroxy-tetrahydrodipicolinate synthase